MRNAGLPFEPMESRLRLAAAPIVGAVLSSTGVLSVRGDRAAVNEISAGGAEVGTAVAANAQSFAAADKNGCQAGTIRRCEPSGSFPPCVPCVPCVPARQ